MIEEIRMTVRLPKSATDFLDSVAEENFTSRNAEIVRSIRERMEQTRTTTGEIALDSAPVVVGTNAA